MNTIANLTTHLVVSDAARASDWYQRVFDAVEVNRIPLPDGRLIHVELHLGPVRLMLADPFPQHGASAPHVGTRPPAVFYLHLEDVDAAWQRAINGGATVVRDLADTFWGEREGQIADPFGHYWGLTQHIEDLSLEQMARLAAQAFGA